MADINDQFSKYLRDKGYTGALPDQIRKALQDETGTSKMVVNDLWMRYLSGEGFNTGTLNDRLYAWLGDKGYSGSLQDRWAAALAANDVFVEDAPSCLYPLDADEAEVTGVGLDGRLTPSNEFQTGFYSIQSGLDSDESYGMYPDGVSTGAGTHFDTTEKKALAINIDEMPSAVIDPESNALRVATSLQVVLSDFSEDEAISLRYMKDGTYHVGFNVAGGLLETLSEAPRQICLFFDGEGHVGASITYADGSTNTYATTRAFAGGATMAGMRVTERSGVDASLSGDPVQITLVTSAADITSPVPAGTKTVCGNEITS